MGLNWKKALSWGTGIIPGVAAESYEEGGSLMPPKSYSSLMWNPVLLR
jgi:hypothetical protein